jgi:hypothetical protein
MTDPLSGGTPASRGSGPLAVLVLVAGVLAVLAIAGLGAYFLSEWVGSQQSAMGSDGPAQPGGGDGRDQSEEPAYAGPLVSATGFEGLRKALQKEIGSSKVVGLTVYPTYAVAQYLEGSGPGRTRSVYYDGTTFSDSGLGTTTDRPLDLMRVDPDSVASLVRRVRKVVDDEDAWYLVLRAPDAQGAAVWAYASNKYGEGGYVSGRLDGTVVDTITW